MYSIALFNDTGNFPHAGCLAVSNAHLQMLKRSKILVKNRFFVNEWCNLWKGTRRDSYKAISTSKLVKVIDNVDAVIVNGEGTIHHGNGLHLLTILDLAQQMGKRTFLVNAVFQESQEYLDTLSLLDDFTVRDLHSSRYLDNLNIKHRLVLDSVLEANFQSKPNIDLTNKIVITDFHHTRKDVGNYLNRLLKELGEDAFYYPLEGNTRPYDWDYFVANLAQSKLVVTGRHHGVYMAGIAGVPFVALPSNTWKIEGTLELFKSQRLEVCEDFHSLKKACDCAVERRDAYKEFGQFLNSQKPLSTFCFLEQFGNDKLDKNGDSSGWKLDKVPVKKTILDSVYRVLDFLKRG